MRTLDVKVTGERSPRHCWKLTVWAWAEFSVKPYSPKLLSIPERNPSRRVFVVGSVNVAPILPCTGTHAEGGEGLAVGADAVEDEREVVGVADGRGFA
jgi:hypothetical protein